ncbi:IS3 family transposase [bacterium]|nr:IS3 family transposase [bacterium]
MSSKELEQAITNYVDDYNNVRIQEKLGWMTPTQFENQL